MNIVALEEHFVTPDLIGAWERLPAPEREDALGQLREPVRHRLLDVSGERLETMDANGIAMQVLSQTTPGVQNLCADDAVRLAASGNDALAEIIRKRPDRFGGFASLPTPAPERAARELERAVRQLGLDGVMLNGRTGGASVDHPDLLPIWEAAADLRAPVYLHPQLPVRAVRDAYYAGLGDAVDKVFAQGAVGWHYETGVQLLRLILAGVFDRFPMLQVIVGHWGEAVLFFLDRIAMLDGAAGLALPIQEYFRRNVLVTPSGIFSQRYLAWAREIVGSERILFSTDYPYVQGSRSGAHSFLESAALNGDERDAVAHGNWERLRARIRR